MGKIIDYKTAKKRMKQKKRQEKARKKITKEKMKTFKHQPYYVYLGFIFILCLLYVLLRGFIA